MIREIDELRHRGQVCRRVDGLTEPLEQWRARIRAAARRDGLAIRTFVIDIDDSDSGNLTQQLAFAVRTDQDIDLSELAAAVDDAAAELHAVQHGLGARAPVTSLADQRARRSAHPCIEEPSDAPHNP